MKTLLKNKQASRGFSLLEMVIVVTVVGIVAYGIISITTAQGESNRIADTRNKMARIEDAINVYFKTYGYLPCPAYQAALNTNLFLYRESHPASYIYPAHSGLNNTSATSTVCGSASSGSTHNDGSVNLPHIYMGVVPVRSLGLSDDYAHDAWGNRISFAVSRYCVAPSNWQTPGSSVNFKYRCSTDGTSGTDGSAITISSAMPINTTTKAVYVLISHGKNGFGAYNMNGAKITAVSLGATAAERANGNLNSSGGDVGDTSITNTYYDLPINDGSAGNYFDDIVRWKTPMQIYYDATR